ncbi:MAG TPA: glycerophosphodiester phosphodiesterase family protein [Verrucomicrobiae bacterium]
MPQRGLCAHRGAMATHPENTIPAFQEAIRLGAQMIEFDVQLSRDGELVLMHDATVDRTTNGKGKVTELAFKELRALDAGVKKDVRFTGTRIPTFEETLEMMPRNVWLNCHLKGGAALGAAVAKAIVRAKRQHQAFMACGGEAAKAAREVERDILICNMDRQANSLDYVQQTIAMKAGFIQLLGKGEVSAEQVRLLKANGVRVNYYHAETPELVKNLFVNGVDFPLVNDLAAFLPIAKDAGIQPVAPVF